ncbi:MAG: ABC transporter substrate-binding protein [Thermomicrobiales bacterium]
MTDQRLTRRMLLRNTATIGVGAAGMALLAACGGAATATPASKPAAAGGGGGGAAATSSSGGGAGAAAQGGKLEIFSWWTSAGEVEALNALYEVYKKSNPTVEIINAAISGGAGAGGNAKAAMKTRMLGGDPPDSFQVHLGHELIDTWVVADKMEPLDALYKSEGLTDLFPKDLLDIASRDGKPWSVPVNIHRSNVLWYSKPIFSQNNLQPPATFDDFFKVAEALKAKNIPAMVVGEKAPFHTAHIFETVLMGTLGADGYRGLWNGKTAWTDAKITDALNTLKKMFDYVNSDYLAVDSGDVQDWIIQGKAAMLINGDWTNGTFKSKKFADYGYQPTMNAKGLYGTLSDSFGLPKGIKDKDNTMLWLKVCASKAGQDAFNPLKGSISARKDADKSLYDDYQKSALDDFQSNQLVPSVVHGAAAKESWVTDYVNTMNVFATNKDVAATQKQLVQIAKDAGVG